LLGAVVFPSPLPLPQTHPPTHPQEAAPFSPSKFISLYLLFAALHFSDSLCACWWCLVFFWLQCISLFVVVELLFFFLSFVCLFVAAVQIFSYFWWWVLSQFQLWGCLRV
jgi:hypothetical protein